MDRKEKYFKEIEALRNKQIEKEKQFNLKTKFRIWDENYFANKGRYLFQCVLATLCIIIVLRSLNTPDQYGYDCFTGGFVICRLYHAP
ncbi:MAG: hypothetical protein ACLFQV_01665 [Vulcanimicrobiota bacterium]